MPRSPRSTALCGYLPLAIRLVAAGLRHHPAWTVTDLAAELATARDRLAAMQAEDVSVAAAFDLSYQDLTAGQQRLFRRLGLHPGADIDAYAAAALDDTGLPATRRRLGELYDQNLIGEPARGRYRLHDLLREYARARAADDGPADNQAAIGRLLDYYLHTAVTAGRHVAWRPSIVGPPPPGPAPAWPRNCARRKRRSPGWGPSAPTCTPVSTTPQPTGVLCTPSGFPLR